MEHGFFASMIYLLRIGIFMGFSSKQQELAELTPEDGLGLGLPGKPLVIASGNLT